MSAHDPGSSPQKLPRPRRVTMAGVMAAVACLLVIIALFDTMAAVRSSQTPDSYRGVLRGLVLASGALAAAGAVLAVYALQRHRGARLGLTITSGLLLASSLALADPIPVLVAVGAAMLWSQEARDWFDGRPPQAERAASRPEDDEPPSSHFWPPPTPGSRASSWPPPEQGSQQPPAPGPGGDRPAEPPADPYAGPGSDPYAGPASDPYAGPATNPYGGPAAGPDAGYATNPQAAPAANPYAGPASHPHAGPASDPYAGAWRPAPRTSSRPSSVTVAAWLTWVFCTLTTLAFLVVVAEVLAARDQLLDSLHSNPALPATWDDRDIIAALWVASAVGIFWSLAAIALAVLAFHRVQIARVALVVSAVVAGLLGGLTIVGLLNTAAAVTVVVLLFTGRANAWYSRRTYPPGPPPPPGASGPPTPPGASGPRDVFGPPGSSTQPGASGPPDQPPHDRPPVW